jgi:hypothetical protein
MELVYFSLLFQWIFCGVIFLHFVKIFEKKNILQEIPSFKKILKNSKKLPDITTTAYNMKGCLKIFLVSCFECGQIWQNTLIYDGHLSRIAKFNLKKHCQPLFASFPVFLIPSMFVHG